MQRKVLQRNERKSTKERSILFDNNNSKVKTQDRIHSIIDEGQRRRDAEKIHDIYSGGYA